MARQQEDEQEDRNKTSRQTRNRTSRKMRGEGGGEPNDQGEEDETKARRRNDGLRH